MTLRKLFIAQPPYKQPFDLKDAPIYLLCKRPVLKAGWLYLPLIESFTFPFLFFTLCFYRLQYVVDQSKSHQKTCLVLLSRFVTLGVLLMIPSFLLILHFLCITHRESYFLVSYVFCFIEYLRIVDVS